MAQIDQGFAPGIEEKGETTQAGRLRRLFQRFRRTISIDDASNEPGNIVVTTKSPHFLSTGDKVIVTGVAGNTAANGPFTITIDPNNPSKFTLNGSKANGAYAGGECCPPSNRAPR
jgi:hypothetical protein